MPPSTRLLITKLRSLTKSKSKSKLKSKSKSSRQPSTRLASASPTSQPISLPVLSCDIPSGSLVHSHGTLPVPANCVPCDDPTIGEDVDLDASSLDSNCSASPWVDLGDRPSTFDPASQLLLSAGALSPACRRRCQTVHFGPAQLTELIHLCGVAIRERALDTLGIFRPWRFAEMPNQIGRVQLLFIDLLHPTPPSASDSDHLPASPRPIRVDDVRDELVFTHVHNLIHVLKWAIRHLSYGPARFALESNWYTTFSRCEHEEAYPSNAYEDILLPLLPPASQGLFVAVLDLIAAVAAHVDRNAMPASQLCKYLGFWVLGLGADHHVSYKQIYFELERAGSAFEHIFLVYLRGQARLPKRLKEFISIYPARPSNAACTPPFTPKSIKVLKVQIETIVASPPPEPTKSTSPILCSSSASIRRGASLRSRSRRSASISISTPASAPRAVPSRTPLDILKAAGQADLNQPASEPIAPSATIEIWQSAIAQARSSDRHALFLANAPPAFAEVQPLLGLLDDETLRVLRMIQQEDHLPDQPPSAVPTSSPSHFSPPLSQARSFSLDLPSPHPPRPLHLSTLFEETTRILPTSLTPISSDVLPPNTISVLPAPMSWSDFVASGFSASRSTQPPAQQAPPLPMSTCPAEPLPSRTSISTIRSAGHAGSLKALASKTNHARKLPRARSLRSLRPEDDPPLFVSAPPHPPPALSPPPAIPNSTLRSVTIAVMDESFPDVWLDVLAKPVILKRWPHIIISFLGATFSQGPRKSISDEDPPSHLLIDELVVHRSSPERRVASEPGNQSQLGDQGELVFVDLSSHLMPSGSFPLQEVRVLSVL